jgi:hypothetical protein
MLITYQYEFTVFQRNNGPVIQHACKAHITFTTPCLMDLERHENFLWHVGENIEWLAL